MSKSWGAFFVLAVVLHQVALGQTESASQKSWNVSAGASFLHVFGLNFDQKGTTTIPGWRATASEYPFAGYQWIGGMVQVSGYYDGTVESLQSTNVTANSHQYTFLMGPSVAVRKGRVRPFSDALIGAMNSGTSFGLTQLGSSSNSSVSHTHLATAAGGGVDFAFSSAWSLRAQANWLRVFYSGNSTDLMEASSGLVFRF